MPSRRVHELVDLLLFGRKYTHVHRWMDAPRRFLGKRHRILRHHPIKTPIAVFLMTRDVRASLSAYAHIKLDQLEARLKRALRKKRRVF